MLSQRTATCKRANATKAVRREVSDVDAGVRKKLTKPNKDQPPIKKVRIVSALEKFPVRM